MNDVATLTADPIALDLAARIVSLVADTLGTSEEIHLADRLKEIIAGASLMAASEDVGLS